MSLGTTMSLQNLRNSSNCTAEDIDLDSVEACIAAGEHRLQQVRHWMRANRPELIQ